jgi:hypothetical protein
MVKISTCVGLLILAVSTTQHAMASDSPAASAHVERARVLAGQEFKQSLFPL